MHVLKRDTHSEMWLFADFFAALAMLFMLLINSVSSIQVDPAGNQESDEALVVEVSEQNRWSWEGHQQLTIDEAIPFFPENSKVQLNVDATLDAAELFHSFQKLNQAGISYSFRIEDDQ